MWRVEMTKEQKRELALILLSGAGDIIEWEIFKGLTEKEVAAQLTIWLKRVPGRNWDHRLGQYPTKGQD